MVSDQLLRKQIRRVIGLDIYRATLGDADGRVDAPGLPGYVVIRYVQAGGVFSQPVTVRFRAVMKKTPGAAVIVSFDDDGELAVLRPDFVGETSVGTYPQGDNPADDNVSYFIQQQRLLTFVCHPVSSAADSMLVAVQTGTVVDLSTDTFTLFFGSQEDLTAYIPGGAGEWCLACLFWKDDNSIEIFASTPKDNPDDLGIDDINECMAARTAGSLPIWAWRLYNGQTGIASGAPADGGDDYMDLRPLWFMLQAGGGGSGITQLTGDVTAGPGSGSQTATLATVNGNVGSFTNANITVNGKGLITAASSGTASPWTTDSNVVNLVTDGDTVTIGSATAGGKLFVDGDADEVQLQVQGNGTQTSPLAVFEDSAGNDQVTISGDGAVVINEEGNDADFRVEGDTDANNLTVDASTNRVGVGTAAPGGKVMIDGNADEIQLLIQGNGTQTALPFVLENSGGTDQITFSNTGAAVFNEAGNDADFRVEGDTNASVLFVDASRDAVGIGTATPAVSAVLQIESVTKGLLIPKMDATQRAAISSPTEGLLVYDNTNSNFYYYNSGWIAFVGPSTTNTFFNKTIRTTDSNTIEIDASDIVSGVIPASQLTQMVAATNAAAGTGGITDNPQAGDDVRVWSGAGTWLPVAVRQFAATSDKAVNTATAETTLFSTGVGTLTLPADRLRVGSVIRLRLVGFGQRTSGTFIVRVKIGGSTLIASNTVSAAWESNGIFWLDAELACQSIGSSGTLSAQGLVFVSSDGLTTSQMRMVSTSAATINTTGTLAVDATIQFSISNANNRVTVTSATVEVIG